jgi:hypothetical protein
VYADAVVTQFSNLSISPFMISLVDRIKSDRFIEPVSDWLECIDPTSAVDCAMRWARESNTWTCSYVYHSELNHETDLLANGYAKGAFPIVELQISKAALRLATWLNLLTAGFDKEKVVVLENSPENWPEGSGGEL